MTITTIPDLISQLVADRAVTIRADGGGRHHRSLDAGRAAARRRLSVTARRRPGSGQRPRVRSTGAPAPC
ncbi:MAG TPA: hypothetical protein VFH45_09650 [Acidimicrobiales bacterium]|nr:hypothetical protein [Acidimicrobiales bacterium]